MDLSNFKQLCFNNANCKIWYWYRAAANVDKYVILLHGAGCDHVMFEKNIGIFDDSYNIIIWDARGHGLSAMDKSQQFVFNDMYDDCLKLFEIHQMEAWSKIDSNCTLFMVKNAGHNSNQDNPNDVNNIILTFLENG